MLGILILLVDTIWQDARRKPSWQQCCKTKIPDLDLAAMTVYVDFVTAQIAMDYWRALVMKVTEALQDLFAPFLDCFQLQVLVLRSVFPQIAGCEVFCDEVDTVLLFVCPALEASNNIGVIQVNPDAHLCCYLVYLILVKLISFPLYFAPGYVNTLLLIKAFVHALESALTNCVVVSAESALRDSM